MPGVERVHENAVMSTGSVVGWVAAGGVLAGIAGYWVASGVDEERRTRLRLLGRRRARRAEGAAAEAALDDPSFAPQQLKRSARTMLDEAAAVWRGEDPPGLAKRPDAQLIRGWARSREDWLGSGLRIAGDPTVELLRVVNRADADEDRVVMRLRFHVHVDQPRGQEPLSPHRFGLDERWTMCRDGTRWLLVSVAGDPLAGPVLTAPLIPTPAYDEQRLRELSLRELTNQKTAAGVNPGELVDRDAPAALALRDLSLADERFSPLVLAAALAHLVEAWEESSDGSEAPLRRLASDDAVRALFYPQGDGVRRYVTDATLDSWDVRELDLDVAPPAIKVAVTVTAASYLDEGTYVSGSDRERHKMTLTWTLELTPAGADTPRWRLTSSSDA